MDGIHSKMWKDWTQEDWMNATFCDACGLPLLMVPPEHDGATGYYICGYCGVHNYETSILRKKIKNQAEQIKSLEYKIQNLEHPVSLVNGPGEKSPKPMTEAEWVSKD